MEWKSRRRDVPERLEPSLSDGALAEEEGLDRLVYSLQIGNLTGNIKRNIIFLMSGK